MPAGGGDLAGFIYPTYHFAQAWLTRGVIPLWDPYLFGGTPFVGDIQTALFYPTNLLTYFLSNSITFRDLEYLSVLHFYIAGVGMFLFLRYGLLRTDKQPLNRFAAVGGGNCFRVLGPVHYSFWEFEFDCDGGVAATRDVVFCASDGGKCTRGNGCSERVGAVWHRAEERDVCAVEQVDAGGGVSCRTYSAFFVYCVGGRGCTPFTKWRLRRRTGGAARRC